MSVWLAIPSCRPLSECGPRFELWRAQGYKIALLRQNGSARPYADLEVETREYLGWAASTNLLAGLVLEKHPDAQWIVGGGDDTLPDPNHTAEEIAAQCSKHFAGAPPISEFRDMIWMPGNGTFGVMQPTGDRWLDTPESRAQFGEDRGAVIDRIAGSPWMGRKWCERAYGGHGPMFAGYHHCWADEELQLVAERLGVFWQRRDLCHHHDQWLRENQDITPDRVIPQSHFVASASYDRERPLFEVRKRLGFPGSEPLCAKY